MLAAREVDRLENEFINRGEAFFHVSGAGHEGTAVLVPYLEPCDWLHCHYRDKALMIARGISPEMFLHSVLCNDASHSRGRQMSAHMSDKSLNVLSIVGPVGNSALHAAGVAAQVREDPAHPIVLCGLGDGTTQQGEVLEAIAEAIRSTLPVLFLIHDNHLAISTATAGRTFFSVGEDVPRDFLGSKIHRLDGRAPFECMEALGSIVARMREDRKPALVVFDVDRLTSHTNADDQTVYRSAQEILALREMGDPLLSARCALENLGLEPGALDAMAEEVAAEVRAAGARALRAPHPKVCSTAKRALPEELDPQLPDRTGQGREGSLTMREALQKVLRAHLESDPRVTLLGEDIEDPKGDVFGVTKGLSTEFPGRVCNAPLTESTIVGLSAGRALAGGKPVAFLQFADFLPLAYNQITSELGSMFWRTDGTWESPVIIMVACGGLKPGLGPFHAQTLESLAAHVPGLDVMMPSTAVDASGLLNAAFRSNRPTVFFYPKNLLNTRENLASNNVTAHLIPIGKARTLRSGSDIALVGWGNTVSMCLQAAEALEEAGVEATVIDLRSLQPWDKGAVIAAVERTGKLVVAHEDNLTCGLGAEIVATVAEQARRPVAVRRVARPDTYIPCNFANQVALLPSFKRVLEAATGLLDLKLVWERPAEGDPDLFVVEAIGSSPADESVTMAEVLVQVGCEVKSGDLLANVEADKASAELSSPVSGVVEAIHVEEGITVSVGAPLFAIRCSEPTATSRSSTVVEIPRIHRRPTGRSVRISPVESPVRHMPVGLAGIGSRLGSRVVLSDELAEQFPEVDVDGVIRRTGIERRHWVAEDESPLSLAVDACREVLSSEELALSEVDLIVCSTGTPISATPSMACLVLHELSSVYGEHQAQVYDVNAACSGYLTALQCAYDFLQFQPEAKALVVTTEALSTRIDPQDFSTALLFGDAATATVLYGRPNIERARALVFRPELSGMGDDGSSLRVPLCSCNGEHLHMDGTKVFAVAVRKMVSMLKHACASTHVDVDDLGMIVPHQANQRIIDAIRNRIGFPHEKMFSNIRHLGNTSSSSIPLGLIDVLPTIEAGEHIGLCAFGGGFTFGAGILTIR